MKKKSVLFLQINLLIGAKIYKNAEICPKMPILNEKDPLCRGPLIISFSSCFCP